MAGNDNDEVLIGGDGQVFIAPVGTPGPTDLATPLNAAFVDLGYITDDGVVPTLGKTIAEWRAWQSDYPVRRRVTERFARVQFTLMQWNRDNVEFATEGTVVSLGGGEYRLDPPALTDIAEKAMVIEWADGTKNYRWYMRRGMIEQDVEFNLQRTDIAGLPITFGVIGEAGQEPWQWFTDDPAFAAAGS